jgi:hypothetical protein
VALGLDRVQHAADGRDQHQRADVRRDDEHRSVMRAWKPRCTIAALARSVLRTIRPNHIASRIAPRMKASWQQRGRG